MQIAAVCAIYSYYWQQRQLMGGSKNKDLTRLKLARKANADQKFVSPVQTDGNLAQQQLLEFTLRYHMEFELGVEHAKFLPICANCQGRELTPCSCCEQETKSSSSSRTKDL